MTFWDFIFNRVNEEKIADAVASGEIPSIQSSEELELYLKYKIQDAEFAKIFTQILDKIGSDGVIEIKKGGGGNPYRIEYVQTESYQMMSKKGVKRRKKEIMNLLGLDNSLSDSEIQKYQQELAQLSGSHAIIWINSDSDEDFTKKEDMFAEAIKATTKPFKMK